MTNWDSRFLNNNLKPSPWVRRFAHPGKLKGTALDLACGNGRNGRWLMKFALHVTFLDKNIVGLADLVGQEGIEIVSADLETQASFPLLNRNFDCVVVSNYLYRNILDNIGDCVSPRGVLVYETFGVGNEKFGRPRNPEYLLRPGELLRLFENRFRIIGYEHGIRSNPSNAVVQRIAGVRI